jgi:POT family proton-dependent oligopeptide transporter
MGQQASTGLTTFNAFWSYIMPLVGAWVADEKLGRYLTIQYSILIAIVGHIILIISAIPPVIVHPHNAIACFSIGIVIMGVGVGGFKSNISPLIAEQYKEKMHVKTTSKGERVIVDPAFTIGRIYLYFYFIINCGSLIGSISMVFAEKYVGFWLSFTLPTIFLVICGPVLMLCKKRYVLSPPQGSVMGKAFKLFALVLKGQISWNPLQTWRNIKHENFWNRVKPSVLGDAKPKWMTFNDVWVDEVRRGVSACKVFAWYPVYWLAYGQMTNNLTSQAATMKLGGAPNDIIANLNPLFIIALIPIMDWVVYPGLARMGFVFSPIKRITCGFFFASMSMVSATVTQHYIYKMSPCGYNANACDEETPITVWVQIVPYALIGLSEIMASITSLEYAFTKAPKNMRSSVTAVSLFMNAISSAISQALNPLCEDPLLVWNYGVVAVLALIGGIGFWLTFYKLDKDEDKMNAISGGEIDSGAPITEASRALDDEQSVGALGVAVTTATEKA